MLTDMINDAIIELVENAKDVLLILQLIKDASIHRVYTEVEIDETPTRRVIEKKDLPTRDLVMAKLKIGRAMAHRKLQFLRDKDLIKEDKLRSYTYQRGRKTVYTLTAKGESTLKSLLSIY